MSKLNDISSIPFRDKIYYVLTVCLYCWYLWVSKVGIAIQNSVFRIIRLIVSLLLPKRYLYKLCRNQVNGKKELNILFRDFESGDDIRTAKDMVFFTCCGYLALPLALISSIICSLIGWYSVMDWMTDGVGGIVIPSILMLLIFLAVSKLTNTYGDPNFYLPYFRKFKKMDEEWLTKWKRYTILLFVGGLLSVALSLGFILLCIAIQKNYI